MSFFPQEHTSDSGGCKGGGIGHGHGQGNRGVAENGEESSGGREVNEKGDRVLPDEEELDPVSEDDEDAVEWSEGGIVPARRFENLFP